MGNPNSKCLNPSGGSFSGAGGGSAGGGNTNRGAAGAIANVFRKIEGLAFKGLGVFWGLRVLGVGV